MACCIARVGQRHCRDVVEAADPGARGLARSALAGFATSASALTVGKAAVTSNTPSARTATTAGPLA